VLMARMELLVQLALLVLLVLRVHKESRLHLPPNQSLV
jgi:hypothetical protein